MTTTVMCPCWIGDVVYKICPKCNDKHDGSCRNCAWESCIWDGCDVGTKIYPDGSCHDGTLQIVKITVGKRNFFIACENFGTMYFASKEDAEEGLREFEQIRAVEDKKLRVKMYAEWVNKRRECYKEVK